MNNIENLQDFIKRAERNYKYKPNTAGALSAALKLFSTVMTDDELSEEKFPIDKLDEIAERIHTKFADKYSVDSLQTYKSRITRVVKDFAQYGSDAKSMASWNPLTKQRTIKPKLTKTKLHKQEIEKQDDSHLSKEQNANIPGLKDITLPLTNNRNVVIYYPTDLTEDEASKLGTVLKSIAALNS